MDYITSPLRVYKGREYKTVSARMRAERRDKAARKFWSEYGKPFVIAAVALPFLYFFLVASIIVLQSLTGEYCLYNVCQ